jgi:hypothetical protein
MSYRGWNGYGNSAYEMELNDLRREGPNNYYEPGYRSNEAVIPPRPSAYAYTKPASKKGWRKLYATMCCGSAIGAGAWVLATAMLVGVIVVLSIKLKVG